MVLHGLGQLLHLAGIQPFFAPDVKRARIALHQLKLLPGHPRLFRRPPGMYFQLSLQILAGGFITGLGYSRVAYRHLDHLLYADCGLDKFYGYWKLKKTSSS